VSESGGGGRRAGAVRDFSEITGLHPVVYLTYLIGSVDKPILTYVLNK